MGALLRSPWLKALGFFFLLGMTYGTLKADIDGKADKSEVRAATDAVAAALPLATFREFVIRDSAWKANVWDMLLDAHCAKYPKSKRCNP